MWGLGILLVLWVLVAPIFALVSAGRANRRAAETDAKLRLLRAHFDETVEQFLTRAPSGAPAPPPTPRATPAAAAESARSPFAPPPRSPPTPPAPPAPPAAPFPAPEAIPTLLSQIEIIAPRTPEPKSPEETPPAPPQPPPPALAPEPPAGAPEPGTAPAPPEPPLPPLPEPAPPPPPPAEPASPPRPPLPPRPPRPADSLETKIGSRWTVIVGGIALALGAIFLVRYSIEQGMLGPPMRIALGVLLSLVLFAAGEAMRRRDRRLQLPVFAFADIPAVLTGAGGVALFATIYAAYALYGFIGPAGAFVLLTGAGLITLFLSVIHGPALAALGAVGSYVAPLLVSSNEPAPFPLVFHTLAVTAAVMGMARIRNWRWLAVSGIVASLLWGAALGLFEPTTDVTHAKLLLLGGLAVIFIASLLAGSEPTTVRDHPPEPYSLAALTGLSLLSLVYGRDDPSYPQLVAAVVGTGVLGAVASRWSSAAGLAIVAGLFAALAVMLLPADVPFGFESIRINDVRWLVLGDANLERFALKAAAIGIVIGAGSFLSADRAATTARYTAGAFAVSGAAAPLAILIIVYLRHVPFETRPMIGLAAFLLAAVYAAMTEVLITRRPEDDTAPAPALYAAGAVLALAFAASVGLTTRFIPLSLSLGAAGVVWVSLYRPVRILAWLAVALAVFACIAIGLGTAFTPSEIGSTPILNGLILRLGVPAAAMLLAGEVLRRRRGGIEAAILQTLGLVVGALFVAFEIRHAAGGGDILYGNYGLGEQSAYTLAALAFALGLQGIARQTESQVYRGASLVAGFLGAAAIAIAHFITVNPLITGDSVGTGYFLNLLLPGYLLPALAAGAVGVAARGVRPPLYVNVMEALAALLAFAYVILMVRHAFEGEFLTASGMRGLPELSAYTIATLAFAVALQWVAEKTQSTVYTDGSIIAGVVAAALVLGGHFVLENPLFTGDSVGPDRFVNMLLPGYIVPALVAAAAGLAARGVRPGPYVGLMEALAALLAFAYVMLSLRHEFWGEFLDGEDVRGLRETSAYTLAALAFAFALQWIGDSLRSVVYRRASMLAGLAATAAVVIGHFIVENPFLTGESVRAHPVLNLLVPGYLLPAVAAAGLVAVARRIGPRPYVLIIAATTLALALAYVTLMVRHAFHGEYLDGWTMRDAENWTYSAVWLVFGILLLAAGIVFRSTMVRAASALVLAAVVFKVFLFDMAALTGVLRAVSFLGLGVTLIVIGRLYQRLLMRGGTEEAPPI